MKIFVPISDNGSGAGKTGWAISLASSFNGRHVQFESMSGSHADRACNNMANAFLRTDCDVMLIIDIDTIFRETDIARILGHIERGVKCVWGLYPKKQDDAPPCVNTWPDVPPPDEHGLVSVRRAGRGFLAIVREVFERLKEDNGGPALRFHNHVQIEWAFFYSGVVQYDYSAIVGAMGSPKDKDCYPMREWITEDWMFCEDIRFHLGIPTLVDTGIVLAHVGEKIYRFPANQIVRTDSNITSWRDIHGWFDYEDVYRKIVAEIPDGGTFVEVGCWLGRSIGAFHEFAKEAGKTIHLHVVDTFNGEPANAEQAEILAAHGGSVVKALRANMEAIGMPETMWIHTQGSPHDAAAFDDALLDAVFIDASHKFEDVLADIAAWYPKVKKGGIIAGHDIDEAGVVRAILESRLQTEVIGRCWFAKK